MNTVNPTPPGAPSSQTLQQDSHHVSAIYARSECLCANATGRNLVICIDGTLNQANEMPSNVIKLYSLILKDATQLTYYNSGIGTYVRDLTGLRSWYQWASQMKDIMIASNLNARILSAYQWLTENYVDGDRIFLFGFSRGAYQVRVIAGMLHRVGLLHKGNNEQIPFAYENYQKSVAGAKDDLCDWFKSNFSRPSVRAHFVGAWDTVSSVGLFQGTHLPETTNGMKYVCAFRHALALDERRVKFSPDFANGSAPCEGTNVKEVWFAGFHSDIGGTNITDESDKKAIGGPALLWMIYEANYFGLRLRPHHRNYHSSVPISTSMNWFWNFFEYIPFLVPRMTCDSQSMIDKYGPHLAKPRQIVKGQLIHISVREKIKKDGPKYIPAPEARFKNGSWDLASLTADDEHWFEKNWYLDAGVVLSRITKSIIEEKTLTEKDMGDFWSFASNGLGRFSIISQPTALDSLIAVCREKYDVQGDEFKGPDGDEIFAKHLSDAISAFIMSPLGDTTRVQRLATDLGKFLDEHTKKNSDDSLAKRYKLLREAIDKSKHRRHLVVYICSLDEQQLKFRFEAMDLCLVTPERGEAHIQIACVANTPAQLQVDVIDKDITGQELNLKLKSRFVPDTTEDISYIMGKLLHYYQYLKCTSDILKDLIDNISISFFEVQDSVLGFPRFVKVNDALNLCKNSVINIDVSGSIYGLEITNNNRNGETLFPVVLYFDNTECTISNVYPGTFFAENEDAFRVQGETLTIGYGDGAGSNVGPLRHVVGPEHDVVVGFYRIFLFKGNTDVRRILQAESAFQGCLGRLEEPRFSPLNFDEIMPYSWGATTVTVIQRKSDADH